jgi:hypothetical protein
MNDTLIAYYQNLLILQYKSKPNANSFLQAVLKILMIYDLMISVRDGYDPNTAIGSQQDILGKYAGVSRVVTGVDFTRSYFGFMRAGTGVPYTFSGFMKAGTIPPDEQFLRAGALNNSVYSLTDPEFQSILEYRINRNYINPTLKQIDEFILKFFGSGSYFTDNEDMSISYFFPTNQARMVTIAQSMDLIPRPAGVEILLNFEST